VRIRSERASAMAYMAYKLITSEFVVSTILAIVLAIGLSFGAVYLTNNYLFPVGPAQAGIVDP
jgi:uncharacterized membrane protein YciS (DUF1049 family)